MQGATTYILTRTPARHQTRSSLPPFPRGGWGGQPFRPSVPNPAGRTHAQYWRIVNNLAAQWLQPTTVSTAVLPVSWYHGTRLVHPSARPVSPTVHACTLFDPPRPLMSAADAKIGRCYASILALAVSGACAAAFGPLSGAGAPQGLLIPLALLWGSSAVAVRLLLWCRTAQIIYILF